MKKSFAIIALAALVMLAGCKKNDPQPNGTRLIAGIEKHKSDSKTSLDGLQIKWSENDQLYVNNGTNSAACFTLVSSAGTTTGEFATTGEYTFAAENNLAVYPYNYVSGLDNTTVTMTLPAVQEASGAGSFGNGTNPMLGTFSDMDNLTLTSLCGVLCLQLTGNNVGITAIEIVGGPDDKLNGTFTVNDYTNPVLTYSANGTNTVRLNCNDTLTSMAKKFYVVVPAGTLHGFTMKVYNGDNEIFSKSTTNDIPVSVNTLSTMLPVEVVPAPAGPPALTMEALTAGNVVVNIFDLDNEVPSTLSTGMKYSVNGGAKTTIYETTTIPVNAGDKVQFYGNGTSTQVYGGYSSTVMLQGTAQTKVYGNIMSLIDETGYATLTTLPNQNYVFRRLFEDNANLTDASGLLLPATTLTGKCYAYMFSGCASLTTAPALPATTLTDYCYESMFKGCTSLPAAPELPATTLANFCYWSMFEGCTSLVTAPALSVTTLAEGCYSGMFSECTSLTTAPVLPAETLVSSCYNGMFWGCTSLSSITCLATAGINENYSTFYWVNSVASTGTFTKASGATWPAGDNGIPSGWTVN